MAIVPGTNVIARELTVAVPGSVGLEDGGDGLGQLIHLGLVLGGLRAVRSAHRMTAAPDGRAEPSVVAAVPGALRWRGLGGRGTRVGRDCQGWRELSGRKVRRAYRVSHPACQPGVLRTGSPANTTKSSPPHATGGKASRVHPYTALPHVVPGHFSLLTRHDDMSLCIVRFRERRGSQGCSCTPGWPGQAAGGHQPPPGGDQLRDSPGRLCRGPPPHRGRRRGRAAGVRPRHGGRPGHGGRRGAERSGRNGGNAGRDTGGPAAAARDRGAFSIPGDP